MASESEIKIVDIKSLGKSSDAQCDEKLLLDVLKNLFNEVDSDTTRAVLTNLELVNILQKEFQINIEGKTVFELDVYMNVFKKFFGSWPLWDEFDRLAKKRKTISKANINKILYEHSILLKSYLKENLVRADVLMQMYLKKVEKKKDSEAKDVVMEILSTRAQLNQLFFKSPHPGKGHTIFNIVEGASRNKVPHPGVDLKISLHVFTINEIVNWPNVKVTISLPDLECNRRNSSDITRTLKNMKLSKNILSKQTSQPLNTSNIYSRVTNNKVTFISKENVLQYFVKLRDCLKTMYVNFIVKNRLISILEQFILDLERGPSCVLNSAEYQTHLNNYKYVRHLGVDVDDAGTESTLETINPNNFDLMLEEMLTPAHTFQILKCNVLSPIDMNAKVKIPSLKVCDTIQRQDNWIRVECLPCQKKFDIGNGIEELQEHFLECHQSEPDWECTGCHVTTPMATLSSARWHHQC